MGTLARAIWVHINVEAQPLICRRLNHTDLIRRFINQIYLNWFYDARPLVLNSVCVHNRGKLFILMIIEHCGVRMHTDSVNEFDWWEKSRLGHFLNNRMLFGARKQGPRRIINNLIHLPNWTQVIGVPSSIISPAAIYELAPLTLLVAPLGRFVLYFGPLNL